MWDESKEMLNILAVIRYSIDYLGGSFRGCGRIFQIFSLKFLVKIPHNPPPQSLINIPHPRKKGVFSSNCAANIKRFFKMFA